MDNCGCVFDGDGFQIATTDYDVENNLYVRYMTVCEDCKNWYAILGLILTQEQIDKFFG